MSRAGPRSGVGGLASQPFSEGGDTAAHVSADDDGSPSVSDDAEPEETDEDETGTSLRALSCLEGEGGNDNDGARRGVQKRDFMKRRRVEIAALGGYYASDALSSTYVYGGRFRFSLGGLRSRAAGRAQSGCVPAGGTFQLVRPRTPLSVRRRVERAGRGVVVAGSRETPLE